MSSQQINAVYILNLRLLIIEPPYELLKLDERHASYGKQFLIFISGNL